MSRDKLIIVGVLVLGLLGFAVYKQEQKDQSMGQPTALAKDFPAINLSSPDDVDKVSIVNGDKGEVVLERQPDPKGGTDDAGAPSTLWMVTKPVKALASQQAVKDVLANMKDLKVDSAVNLKLDDAVKKDKQLDDAHAVHVVAYKGADKKIDDYFGKSGAAGQLVLVPSKPENVWAAKGYSSYLYTKEAKDWRDKEVWKIDDSNAVSGIAITNSKGALSFTKGDKWAATLDNKPMARFDEEKVKTMLSSWKGLSATDFGDGKSLADTGLDKPEATVVLTLKDGAGRYELQIGKADGSDRWAKKAGSDQVYKLGSFVTDWATSDASKFQAAVDAGAGDGGGAKPPATHPK